jgi:hypothetical protein
MNNAIVLNLIEARVTLYTTAADGLSLGSALWSGQVAERLTVREQWVTLETRPAGAAYPIKHPLVPQYEISIDRVWALPLNNLVGFSPTNQTYVLEVIWTEEDTQQWHRRRFYGVTIASRSFGEQNIESEFVDEQEFAAQYVLVDAGGTCEPPSPLVAMPLVVFWSGPDAPSGMALYTYDAVNGFVVADPPSPGSGAASVGRATIAADGSSIIFTGASGPVLATTAAGPNLGLAVTVGELHDTLPTDLPQLQFYLGTTLLGVVNTVGIWARVIADAPSGVALPAAVGFEFEYAGVPVMVMNPANCTALAWATLN